MEVRRAGKEEELVDQESQDVRGAEKERHAEKPRGRHQQRAGKKEKEEIAGRPGTSPTSPPAVREWRPEWIPAYLSNGLIGLRVGTIPLIEGLCIVNGLAAVDPVEQGEAFARAPYPIGGDLEIDGRKLSRVPREARLIEQRYDFSCGELISRYLQFLNESIALEPALVRHKLLVGSARISTGRFIDEMPRDEHDRYTLRLNTAHTAYYVRD